MYQVEFYLHFVGEEFENDNNLTKYFQMFKMSLLLVLVLIAILLDEN